MGIIFIIVKTEEQIQWISGNFCLMIKMRNKWSKSVSIFVLMLKQESQTVESAKIDLFFFFW